MAEHAPRKSFSLRPPALAGLVVAPVLSIAFFLAFSSLYLFPSFSRLLRNATLQQAITAAQLLAASLISEDQPLERGSIHEELLSRIKQVQRQGQVIKIRIYSPMGEVVHSSEAREVGTINRDPYFQEILIGHRVAAKEVGLGDPSLEGQRYPVEVIETYVPIARQGRLLGVLEIYYDAALQNRNRHSLAAFSSAIMVLAAIVLLAAVGVSASGVRQLLSAQQQPAATTDPIERKSIQPQR
jgi:hypothetical protein